MKNSSIDIRDLPDPPFGKSGWPWTVQCDPPSDTRRFLKISIVTPSFNQGEYLEETIRSILLQGYSSLELIIIDGGSNDESVNIIRKYERWISFWTSEPDNGQAHAINKGLQHVSGDVFNWINSDDILLPNALHEINSLLIDSDALVARGHIRFFGIGTPYLSSSCFTADTAESIGYCPVKILQPSTFFRSRLFLPESVGIINEQLKYVFDLEWMIRFLFRYGTKGIVQSSSIWSAFRLHGRSKTVTSADVFEMECNSIFFSIASQVDDPRKLVFTDGTIAYAKNLEFQPYSVDRKLMTRSLNFFMVYIFEVAYARRNNQVAEKLFKMINLKDLSLKKRIKVSELRLRNFAVGVFKKFSFW